MTSYLEQSDEPYVSCGAKVVSSGVFLLEQLLSPTRQVNLWKSIESRSKEPRYNPHKLVKEESWRVATATNIKLKNSKVMYLNDRPPLVRAPLYKKDVHPMINLNTWKDDDLALPFEWLEVCNEAAALIEPFNRTKMLSKPFFPAKINAMMYEHRDGLRLKPLPRASGTLLLSLGCDVSIIIRKHGAKDHKIRLRSGDGLLYNASIRNGVQVFCRKTHRETCPVFLVDQDYRLAQSHCNITFSDNANTDPRTHQRLLRRTFEIDRRDLWRQGERSKAPKTRHTH